MQDLIFSIIGATICLWILVYFYLLWKKAKSFSTYHPALDIKKRMLTSCIVIMFLSLIGIVFSLMRIFS